MWHDSCDGSSGVDANSARRDECGDEECDGVDGVMRGDDDERGGGDERGGAG